ncbi:unnamed protein product, partial [Ixodes persulcatus]
LLPLLVLSVDAPADERAPENLDLVIGLFRHGDRAPMLSYLNDPHHDSKYWHHGYGELTLRGIQTMIDLGRYLRTRYQYFLSNDTKETKVRSSPTSRCFTSASFLLYELHPATGSRQWKIGEQWFPIPITRIPEGHDKYTLLCLSEMKKLWKQTVTPNGKNEGLVRFLVGATAALHLSVEEHASIIPVLLDAMVVQKEYALPLLPWFEERYNNLSSAHKQIITMMAKAAITNMGGEILRDIADHLEMRYKAENATSVFSSGRQQRSATGVRFQLLAYHDLNLMATLMGLDSTFSEKPHYGSIVLFEVTTPSEEEPEIRVLYRNGTQGLVKVPIQGCTSPCTVSRFILAVRERFPTSFSPEVCGYPKGHTVL